MNLNFSNGHWAARTTKVTSALQRCLTSFMIRAILHSLNKDGQRKVSTVTSTNRVTEVSIFYLFYLYSCWKGSGFVVISISQSHCCKQVDWFRCQQYTLFRPGPNMLLSYWNDKALVSKWLVRTVRPVMTWPWKDEYISFPLEFQVAEWDWATQQQFQPIFLLGS